MIETRRETIKEKGEIGELPIIGIGIQSEGISIKMQMTSANRTRGKLKRELCAQRYGYAESQKRCCSSLKLLLFGTSGGAQGRQARNEKQQQMKHVTRQSCVSKLQTCNLLGPESQVVAESSRAEPS